MEEIKRESVYRHKSERMLDRFLYKIEKKNNEELKAKMKQLQKINEFRSSQKRRKLEMEEQNKLKKEQEEKEVAERREKYKEVDHYEALCKIMKHIYEEKKFSKCLQMLIKLLEQYFDFFDGHTIFNVLDGVMRYEKKFEKKEDREAIERLYIFIMELSESYNGGDEAMDSFFTQDEESMIELYYIPIIVQSALYTDDSFKFNEVIREVNDMLSSLALYNKKQDQFQELCTSKKVIMEYFKGKSQINDQQSISDKKGEENQDQIDKQRETVANSLPFNLTKCLYEEKVFASCDETEIKHFLNGIKRRLFFETLKHVFDFRRFAWAKVTVTQTIKKVYLEKEKFNEDEQEEMEEMISALQSNISTTLKNGQNRERIDDKIKNNPLESAHQIKDNRADKIIYNGSDKWAQKQIGLTWSDNK